MQLIDLIARAGRIGQKQDFYNTFVCVSPEVFDALIHLHPDLSVWQRAECDDGYDYRSTRLPKPCDLEVWAMREIPVTTFSVCVHGLQISTDYLYQSNHERLLFDAQLEETLNDRLLAMAPERALSEAWSNGEDTAAFAQRMNEFVRGRD